MDDDKKITTGMNDRPRNDTIAQTGAGIPDDSGGVADFDDSPVVSSGREASDAPREQLEREVKEEIEKPQRGSA
ncbi:MAG: hypothetical protein ACK4N1_15150 [Pseudorhizobium sp.]